MLEHVPSKGTVVFVLEVACYFLQFGPGRYNTTLFSVLVLSVGRYGLHPHNFSLLNFEILVFQMASRSDMLHWFRTGLYKVIAEVAWKGFFWNDKDVCEISLECSHLCALLRLCRIFRIDTSFNHLKIHLLETFNIVLLSRWKLLSVAISKKNYPAG